MRAKVRFFDADPTEEEMERSTSTALQRIRQKMRDALAIQGDMEQAQELGDLARRLRPGGRQHLFSKELSDLHPYEAYVYVAVLFFL